MKFDDPKIQALFTAAHFKFSTLDPGRKIPTLYFEDANGIKGRIRQEHPKGKLIAYQGNCIRQFVSPAQDIESDVLVEGYHVWEELGEIGHGSQGLVQPLNTNADTIKGFDLSQFKDVAIVDWTAPVPVTH